jgi:hypothetical protein
MDWIFLGFKYWMISSLVVMFGILWLPANKYPLTDNEETICKIFGLGAAIMATLIFYKW